MSPQDSFIDDEDEVCPLCIEELDLSDRNFRPCPCGYQICQFCFNNIKNNMNSLCPACRRPYDEKTIQWKVVTPEEIAEFRANIQKNQKKRAAEQRQKEVQKREAEKENRKNLVGVRVVQKNLVYVTGLTPTVREDELLRTLRKHEFFGQYGTIQKISISNRKSSDGQNQSLGIYVTFEKQEDASRCIQAVNGSHNGDRVLRAQLGTTKYCSAWLRHEQCANRQCMFLHELGEEEDSYTRQDLSSMNSISTQRPLASSGSSRSTSRQQPHPSPAPQAAQPMVRSSSKEESENGDGSALPSSANWARNPQVRSRRGSHATSGAAPSPAISNSLPATAESAQEAVEEASPIDTNARRPIAGTTTNRGSSRTPFEKAKRIPQDTLANLLKSLAGCRLPFPKDAQVTETSYPPLFDPRGGEKRRTMRDVSDAGIPDEQEQVVEAREASEGEPESSGSLALGGEPEDRDHSREGHGFDLRRVAQPPIQRSGADGLFGPALGSAFGQSGANLGTVGNRTMTPQQPAFMRPQGAFVDHLPPGITAQANLFQGQGHNRQGSRFSFANENRDATSSTAVKLTANPRIMAQQSSMMPSAFHNQPGSQYYASSMPGPPPGLKSTGTPPSMFGQHGFGSAAFGGASKDSNEILQLFNRGRGAGSQAHDAGKREYMFPSYPNQYPPSNSSTPAPASSLLASLYGSQPGAFQDFGSKQKKKGKKHRHANTSSSGGSGLVDLADPSILQARMQSQQHLQQQSNGGLGQGLFGGQSQAFLRRFTSPYIVDDDGCPDVTQAFLVYNGGADSFLCPSRPSLSISQVVFPFALHNPTITEHCQTRRLTGNVDDDLLSLEGAATIVDALVSDEPVDVNIRQPPGAFEGFGRVATPLVPPGLGPPLPHSHPSPAVSHSSLLAPGRSQTPPVALPIIPAKPAAASVSTPTSSKKATASSAPEAKKNIKILAVESGLSKDIAKAKSQKTLQDEDFPALGTPKVSQPAVTPVAAPKAGLGKAAPSSGKKAAEKIVEKEKSASTKAATNAVKTETHAAEKRPTPGILNIAAATKASQTKTADPHSAVEKSSAETDSAFPALPPAPIGSVSSPAARAPPKTLRVVSTPKTDVPPAGASGSAVLPTPSARSAAVAAIRPETPVSELISDSASIISASISASRTNSPPPSKVGSAPVRSTTKSQQRKQRKEALKKDTVSISAPAPKPEPEVEIAPIVGRKKKQKKEKEKEKPISHSATPATSRPQTPIPHAPPPPPPLIKEVKEAKEETSAYRSTANETTMLTEDAALHKTRHTDPKGKQVGGSRMSDQTSTPRSLPTPAMVLQQLREEGLVPESLDDLSFFKPTSWQSDKLRSDALPTGNLEHTGKNSIAPTKSIVTEQDQALLLAGKPVRKVLDGIRVLLTPNGDCIRNLSEVEEEHFLALQRSIAEQAGSPAVFVSSRHETSTGFSLIKGRAVPNGPPSYFPPAPGTYPTDPMSKFQREEAIYYINQYVLPRLNLNARDVSFPHSKLNTQWGPDAKTGAAANLLAPWMYGTKGPQYGNDAAAPELNYPGPVGSFADTVDPTLEAYFDVQTEAISDPTSMPPPMDEMIPALPGYKDNNAAAPNMGQSGPFAGVPLMSYEDAEQALSLARKETEKLEKALNQIMRKNRRVLTMAGGGH
ncbi:hypothetical protein B0T14DRAFT_556652 [Immersiella caudata]|uniref:General negative regulator of transcription subunit 4 n=1 Tax=Immersiella caudata TaxID=314043 RepID=A0AA40BXN9_9PEZI|nr:hypothetical protein B0T14DRAFT_556652 [Immersiella caudata]